MFTRKRLRYCLVSLVGYASVTVLTTPQLECRLWKMDQRSDSGARLLHSSCKAIANEYHVVPRATWGNIPGALAKLWIGF